MVPVHEKNIEMVQVHEKNTKMVPLHEQWYKDGAGQKKYKDRSLAWKNLRVTDDDCEWALCSAQTVFGSS